MRAVMRGWPRRARFGPALVIVALALAAVLGVAVPQSQAQPSAPILVDAGMGVSFAQVDLSLSDTTLPDSSTAELDLDIAALQSATGVEEGYLNVAGEQGWLVQNLPLIDGFAFDGLATYFPLASQPGEDVTSLEVSVALSVEPLLEFGNDTPRSFPVGAVTLSPGGAPAVDLGAPEPTPEPTAEPTTEPTAKPIPEITPEPTTVVTATNERAGAVGVGRAGGYAGIAMEVFYPQVNQRVANRRCVQANPSNVEAEVNQCGPAAVANGLDWLARTNAFALPHPHRPGFARQVPGGAARTLVGELDMTMNRVRFQPVKTDQLLFGKLDYIDNNNLARLISVEHQYGNFNPQVLRLLQRNPNLALNANVTSAGGAVRSTYRGVPSAQFIVDQVCANAAVELAYISPQFGHVVQVVSAGVTNGVFWMVHNSDLRQGQAGVTRPIYTRLDDTDRDGLPNLVDDPGRANIVIVMAQTYIGPPPPPTATSTTRPTRTAIPTRTPVATASPVVPTGTATSTAIPTMATTTIPTTTTAIPTDTTAIPTDTTTIPTGTTAVPSTTAVPTSVTVIPTVVKTADTL